MIKVFPERCSNCNYSGQPHNTRQLTNPGAWHYCHKFNTNVKYSDSCDWYKRREYIPPGVFTKNKEQDLPEIPEELAKPPKPLKPLKPLKPTSQDKIIFALEKHPEGLTRVEISDLTKTSLGAIRVCLSKLKREKRINAVMASDVGGRFKRYVLRG